MEFVAAAAAGGQGLGHHCRGAGGINFEECGVEGAGRRTRKGRRRRGAALEVPCLHLAPFSSAVVLVASDRPSCGSCEEPEPWAPAVRWASFGTPLGVGLAAAAAVAALAVREMAVLFAEWKEGHFSAGTLAHQCCQAFELLLLPFLLAA